MHNQASISRELWKTHGSNVELRSGTGIMIHHQSHLSLCNSQTLFQVFVFELKILLILVHDLHGLLIGDIIELTLFGRRPSQHVHCPAPSD